MKRSVPSSRGVPRFRRIIKTTRHIHRRGDLISPHLDFILVNGWNFPENPDFFTLRLLATLKEACYVYKHGESTNTLVTTFARLAFAGAVDFRVRLSSSCPEIDDYQKLPIPNNYNNFPTRSARCLLFAAMA